jgi:peptidoglycan hydrolase-like protein with peptidoglycan-binding domain
VRRTFLATLAVAVTALAASPTASGYLVSPQVAGLQTALRARGLYAGEIDGVSGPLTKRGVLTFQRRRGLLVDGVAGPQTRGALGRLGRPLYGARMIQRGMLGWDVSVLQFLLARSGVSPGHIDGEFGPVTDSAVRRLQSRRSLLADGIVGPATRRALAGGTAPAPRTGGGGGGGGSVPALLDHWAAHYGIDASLVRAVAYHESGFNPRAVSPAGARGVMQVMPATWNYVETVLLGRRVPHTVSGNIRVGVAFLHQLLHEFDFNVRRALAAYQQGPVAVRRHGFFPVTRHFVRSVLALRGRV